FSQKKMEVVSEKKLSISPLLSRNQQKVQRKLKNNLNKGSDWFNLPKAEIDQDLQQHLDLLKQRDLVSSQNFYKKIDWDKNPEYFQIGTFKSGSIIDELNSKSSKKSLKRNESDFCDLIEKKREKNKELAKKAKMLKKKSKAHKRKQK
ncbi:MAG: Deoxynucleotidyltransferase terminal-interacting protein 2, partial [Paramarteilia canceri]